MSQIETIKQISGFQVNVTFNRLKFLEKEFQINND